MKFATRIFSIAALAFSLAVLVLPTISTSSLAQRSPPPPPPGGGVKGAPGPVVGAGLPVLVVGYGVYWLVKRRRKRLTETLDPKDPTARLTN